MNKPLETQPFYTLECGEDGKYRVVNNPKPKGWIPDYNQLIRQSPRSTYANKVPRVNAWTKEQVIEAVGLYMKGGRLSKWGEKHGRSYNSVYNKMTDLRWLEPELWNEACLINGVDPGASPSKRNRPKRGAYQ